MLITKYKAKVCKEQNASDISCEESELDQPLDEIIDKNKFADEKSSEAKNKEKEEKKSGREAQENHHGMLEPDQRKKCGR